jgi:hypothetical protein
MLLSSPAGYTSAVLEITTISVVVIGLINGTSYTFYTNSSDASYVWIETYANLGYTAANYIVSNGGIHTATEK